MGRVYLRSKKVDQTSLDTQASNMIKDILILLAIYNECDVSINTELDKFRNYYLNILQQNTNTAKDTTKDYFIGEYHYYNKGIRLLRDLLIEKNVKTYGRRIKKLCYTYRTRPICVPKNTDEILDTLFKYIFENNILWQIFVNDVLKNCSRYTIDIKNSPWDCTAGILGFTYVFLYNMKKYKYSPKNISIADKIIYTLKKIVENNNFVNNCGGRKKFID